MPLPTSNFIARFQFEVEDGIDGVHKSDQDGFVERLEAR